MGSHLLKGCITGALAFETNKIQIFNLNNACISFPGLKSYRDF